jgi:transposase
MSLHFSDFVYTRSKSCFEGVIMTKARIELEPEEALELNKRLRASTVSVRDRQRAQIILLAADGHTQERIGETVGVTRVTVNHWCRRFVKARLAGLADAPGRGRKPSLPVAAVKKALETVTRPPADLGRWSCRTMAQAAGISTASVQRLWAANDIKPHLTRTFKLSKDAHFEEKFWDVIGLYLNPPAKRIRSTTSTTGAPFCVACPALRSIARCTATSSNLSVWANCSSCARTCRAPCMPA